jgi:hypothetical protein
VDNVARAAHRRCDRIAVAQIADYNGVSGIDIDSRAGSPNQYTNLKSGFAKRLCDGRADKSACAGDQCNVRTS